MCTKPSWTTASEVSLFIKPGFSFTLFFYLPSLPSSKTVSHAAYKWQAFLRDWEFQTINHWSIRRVAAGQYSDLLTDSLQLWRGFSWNRFSRHSFWHSMSLWFQHCTTVWCVFYDSGVHSAAVKNWLVSQHKNKNTCIFFQHIWLQWQLIFCLI